MLSVKEIEKCCEFCDGFEFVMVKDMTNNSVPAIKIKESSYYIKDLFIFNELVYPLFLQRTIEGINNCQDQLNSGKWIHIESDCLDVSYDWNKSSKIYRWEGLNISKNSLNKDQFHKTLDNAKEQGITFILDHI